MRNRHTQPSFRRRASPATPLDSDDTPLLICAPGCGVRLGPVGRSGSPCVSPSGPGLPGSAPVAPTGATADAARHAANAKVSANCRFSLNRGICPLLTSQSLPNYALRPPWNGGMTEDFRRSEEHTSELQSLRHLVCRLLLEKKK